MGPRTFIGGYLLDIASYSATWTARCDLLYVNCDIPFPALARLWVKGHTARSGTVTLHGHAEAAESHVFPIESFGALKHHTLARHQSLYSKMNAPSAGLGQQFPFTVRLLCSWPPSDWILGAVSYTC